MDRIRIKGGARLFGDVPISGAKNSAIKLMAASILTSEPLVLANMPRLADTRFMAHLLAHLGVQSEEGPGTVMRLHAADLTNTEAPYELVRKMRATFNVLGPLLARTGQARVSLPGGCAIGARPVDQHLKAIAALGADIELAEGYVNARAPGGLRGAEISFPFVSVGATEHAMLAAVLAKGETVLDNAAREPVFVDLAVCLNAMGARIDGAGQSTLRITGVDGLSGTTHAVLADRIEAGTYAIATAAAGGEVTLSNCRPEHLSALWRRLEAAGVSVQTGPGWARVARNAQALRAVDIDPQPFPGFPTDLQAQFMALMTLAEGASVIRENIFENRFMHAPELTRMGADIQVHGREAIVRGVGGLTGAPVMATDLRASVSLIVAGLAAEGETVVNRVYHLDRGFERLEQKLAVCGADVVRLND
ncbi:MAG: UDP-N-acetylglucosamine 1-carboxyvinyltransferase [Maricaulaceae bacterium]